MIFMSHKGCHSQSYANTTLADCNSLLETFDKNRSDHAMQLNVSYTEAIDIFLGLWRYYRITYCPSSPGVKTYTAEHRRLADNAKTQNPEIYAFMKPIYEKIIAGTDHEAVALFGQEHGCIIIRVSADEYNILPLEYTKIQTRNHAKYDGTVIVSSGL